MIDLQPFCSTDPSRSYLHKPWSRDDYSTATNGHILVRVPRRADIEENDKAPDIMKVIGKIIPGQRLGPLPQIEFPEKVLENCGLCNGSGHQHDDQCESCTCPCEDCNGIGILVDHQKWMSFDGTALALRYVRLLATLPGIMIPVKLNPSPEPMPFSFDGGDGVLMPASPGSGDVVVIR